MRENVGNRLVVIVLVYEALVSGREVRQLVEKGKINNV